MTSVQARVPAWLANGLAALVVFLTCDAVYQSAPVHQLTDSQYTVFQTELGLDHGAWTMDGHMSMPRFGATHEPLPYHQGVWGLPYQLQVVQGDAGKRVVHWYPPGTSVVVTPLYWLAREARWLAPHIDMDDFNGTAEEPAQALLAGWLTAAFAVAVFVLARGWLSIPWSLAVAWALGLGTMALSTQSRGLWSSTSAVSFQMLAVAEVVRPQRVADPRPLRPWLLATWLAWAWFCRPSEAIHIVLVALFVLWQARRHFLSLAAVGGAWLLAFLAWSHTTYGTWLPDYYRHGHLTTAHVGTSLLANTFSPGRGFVVYAPMSLGVLVLLLLFRRALQHRPLLVLAGAAMAAHLALLGVYPTWWAGHAYGARFCVELLPWLALAAVIALASAQAVGRGQPEHQPVWRMSAGVWVLSALAGVAIHLPGAWVAESFEWNVAPIDVNTHPEDAVWNWRYPPFLAGTIGWPTVEPLPVWPLGTPVHFGLGGQDQPFLLERWAGPEQGLRWAYGPRARLAFAVPQPSALTWTFDAHTYCPAEACDQAFVVRWNGHALDRFHIRDHHVVRYTGHVRAAWVERTNIVTIELLNPISPHDAVGTRDVRPLGLAMRTMTLTPE